MNAPAAAAIAMAPTATPTPMPAFAPVERPLEEGAAEAEAVTVALTTLDAVGVEMDVCVAVARPNVDCENYANQLASVVERSSGATSIPVLLAWCYGHN